MTETILILGCLLFHGESSILVLYPPMQCLNYMSLFNDIPIARELLLFERIEKVSLYQMRDIVYVSCFLVLINTVQLLSGIECWRSKIKSF